MILELLVVIAILVIQLVPMVSKMDRKLAWIVVDRIAQFAQLVPTVFKMAVRPA